MSVATCDRVRSHLRTQIHIYGLLSALAAHAHTLRVPRAAQPTAGRTLEAAIVLRLRAGQWLYRELRVSTRIKGKGTFSEHCSTFIASEQSIHLLLSKGVEIALFHA